MTAFLQLWAPSNERCDAAHFIQAGCAQPSEGSGRCYRRERCGRLWQDATASQEEAMAMVQFLVHAKGPVFVISDSRVAISQAESKIFKASRWPVWADVHDRHRLCVEWIGSSQCKEATDQRKLMLDQHKKPFSTSTAWRWKRYKHKIRPKFLRSADSLLLSDPRAAGFWHFPQCTACRFGGHVCFNTF